MKGLNWTKIAPNKVDKTIFGVFGDLNDIEMDFTEIEQQFAAKVVEKKEGKEEKAKPAGPIQIIDPKLGQNLSILLSRFKQSLPELVEGLRNINESMFERDIIKQFIALQPSKEDLQSVSEYLEKGGDPTRLGKAEIFCLESSKVDNMEVRLKSFLFKLEFPTKKAEIRPDIETLSIAVKEVKTSKRFIKLMEHVLVLGNFINGGTFRAGFTGFKLDTLTKLSDTKAGDNKSNLMHWLAKHMQTKSPDTFEFPKDLTHLAAGARVSLQTLQSEVGLLGKELDNLEKIMKEIKEKDKFKEIMDQFLFVTREEFKTLQANFAAAEKEFMSLADWFGEDPAKITPEELFGTLNEFVVNFEKAAEDNRKAKENAEKELKKEQDREKRKLQMDQMKAKTKGPGGVEQDAVVDNLINSLRQGDAFLARRKKLGVLND
eukprot:TRINITY_DN11759_c0_g1_i1.p1 TRINITY_DN11759_c0_g1~~TRINITY_DN11759_c0_g1_i1.p1  ORF type:complete len:431 (+),score=138.76 TRINITY_DN11759_c0_g1_i1:114-1406(+)